MPNPRPNPRPNPSRPTVLPHSRNAAWFALPGMLKALFGRFLLASQRYRQRRHLAELDDRLLADIGLARPDVERECAKPFWLVSAPSSDSP
ncbi:DUF1127 domain-containing protein [Nitratireductor sp. ZSWI3]|uniref:DUF1127 domain-containing protein n=1 Tax=Nitratireductor sp. ZSWI3 TaxID=2966359 RepID=UPI00215069A1|nr:DUF1127 domain-containing protein [Nitratireductor sp. ZSWI3]MCR4266388.1 DUF1127 domain-containing protein [Nitratireductor sp. ZSWI3]